jgi:phosphoribosyl 1,2-cyclic phosphate phosphodiesterase
MMLFTFLGTGSAGGVPSFGCRCSACRRATLLREYRRQSACGVVETASVRWLLDAGLPDLVDRFPAGSVDGILLTHYHMDHVQGLFRARWGCDTRLQVIGPEDPTGCDDLFKHAGVIDFSQTAKAFEPLSLGDLHAVPLPLNHSRPTLGYLLRNDGQSLAYLTDTCGLPADTLAALADDPPDVVVLDCSFAPQDQRPHNHNDLTRALETVDAVRPARCFLTHIGHSFDGWLMEHEGALPSGVEIAVDGLQITV